MFYLKINEQRYPATFAGRKIDNDWDGRESKTITTRSFTYEEILETFVDDLQWSIINVNYEIELYAYNEKGEEITEFVDPETGEPIPLFDKDGNPIDEPLQRQKEVVEEYDNSDFDVAGGITTNRDGSYAIKMGKTTDLEQAYELLYGGTI